MVATYRIASIPGDGIGVDVTAAARSVLDQAADRYGFTLAWSEYDWGCHRYTATGQMMPDDGIEQLRAHDAVFLGAVGYPGVPDHVSLWGLLIPIRRSFDQYVNLRPVQLLPGVSSPLAGRRPGDIDIVVVRENSEGEYSLIGGRHGEGGDELAVQQSVFTRRGVERIARYAFELAGARRGAVCSATKSNGIVHTMPFWDEILGGVAAEYPDIAFEQVHVDALAARFVLAPQHLDVVVGSNLFGDILSDLAAAVAGSLGVAPSANIDPSRKHPSMFESVHGSAPDIAGRGVANPVAQILAGAMMLEHLGEERAAEGMRSAVGTVLGEGQYVTADLGGSATTDQCAEAVSGVLAGSARSPAPR